MATAPEQDQPKTTRNRAKTETFDVFQATEPGSGRFDILATSVEATGRGEAERRKLAIASATASLSEEQKAGEFATCPGGTFVTMTRKRKVEPTDIWE